MGQQNLDSVPMGPYSGALGPTRVYPDQLCPIWAPMGPKGPYLGPMALRGPNYLID